MSETVIRVENLGKGYRLQHQAGGQRERYTALRDVITEKATGLFSRGQRSEDRGQFPDFRLPTSDLRPPSALRSP